MKGRITKGIGGFYYVKVADGTIYECKARGIFRKDNIKPIVGDIVEISVQSGIGNIEKIEQRKNELIRPSVSNIDILVIVVAAGEPEPNLSLLDKLLVNAEILGIEPIICINKTDVKDFSYLLEVYQKTGYKVITASAKNNEGIDALIPYIKGKTSAFAGLSGVGKSTILSLITSSDMQTGEISEKIKRGKHTTRHVELLELSGGGFVFDTPGFSSFEVNTVPSGELYKYFPEMKSFENMCRFSGCSHINEPDCAVKKELEKGNIAKSRYESYVQINNQLKNIKEWKQ